MTRFRLARAARHSQMGFLRGHDDALASEWLAQVSTGQGLEVFGCDHQLIVRAMAWDSRYFGVPIYRIEFADRIKGQVDARGILAGIKEMHATLSSRHAAAYVFADVPSEDTQLLQALGLGTFRLIETRLAYVHREPALFVDARAGARLATVEDIPALRHAASEARNEYDRYHADGFFDVARADAYLADYAEACMGGGMADLVVVPDDGGPASAFVAGSPCVARHGDEVIGRLALAAVAPERQGRYRSLNAAFLGWMAERGATQVVNTTQSTNRAVIHVCEQLGYRFGRASHVFSAVIEKRGAA